MGFASGWCTGVEDKQRIHPEVVNLSLVLHFCVVPSVKTLLKGMLGSSVGGVIVIARDTTFPTLISHNKLNQMTPKLSQCVGGS